MNEIQAVYATAKAAYDTAKALAFSEIGEYPKGGTEHQIDAFWDAFFAAEDRLGVPAFRDALRKAEDKLLAFGKKQLLAAPGHMAHDTVNELFESAAYTSQNFLLKVREELLDLTFRLKVSR